MNDAQIYCKNDSGAASHINAEPLNLGKSEIEANLDIPEHRKTIVPGENFNPHVKTVVRGWYEIVLSIPDVIIPEGRSIYQEFFVVPVHGEQKRIYIEKADFIPLPKESRTKITAIVKVVDNQFLWSTLIWALLGLGGIVGSTFLVDRIDRLVTSSNQFFQESTKDIIILLSAVAGIAVGWKVFFK